MEEPKMKRSLMGIVKASIVLVALLCAFAGTTGFAADGQIDILPTGKATYTISNSGSYILCGDVTMSVNVDCINITTSDVTIDLNGHTISGISPGSASGINGQYADQVRIFNGTIKHFGANGIILRDNATISNVTVQANSNTGIKVEKGGNIIKVTASLNDHYGIWGNSCCLIENCVARGNASVGDKAGIYVVSDSTVKDCVAYNNSNTKGNSSDSYGILTGNGCTIINNTCTGNNNSATSSGWGAHGIKTKDNCTIMNNTCTENSGKNTANRGYGIVAESNCIIINNTCNNNEGETEGGGAIGIWCDNDCLVADNICINNSGTHENSKTAYGILVLNNCIVRGNHCADNDGGGAFIVAGIFSSGTGNRIENNLCNNQSGSSLSYGIFIDTGKADCVVIRNTTHNNASGGIYMGSGANYCAENMTADSSGITGTTGCTMGTGDRANVTY
jgi:hypothetical protein